MEDPRQILISRSRVDYTVASSAVRLAMRKVLWLTASAVGLMVSFAAVAQITPSEPNPATITIRVAATGTQHIAPEIFGSFLEPIGNSINNGLSAEILVNRSLEGGLWNHVNLENMFREEPELIEASNTTGIPLPWQSLNTGAGNRFELHVGDAANSWQSLEIMGQPQELTGIKQRVFLPVQRVLGYNVAVYAKHRSGPTKLSFSFRDRSSGKVLAESSVDAAATEWTHYTATLELQPDTVRRLAPVDFGIAVEGTERVAVDQMSLMPADNIHGLDPEEVALLKRMNITELRFGGNFSSYYHWRDGIGPEDKRPTMMNIAWGIPEYNNFGTDEFLALCKLIAAVPQFDLNMGSGTPEEAAAWVRYIRSHYSGRVLYELGNELYGKWQVGYPTVDEIAGRTLAFSNAVRSVAPDAEIIATGLGPMRGEKWNTALLTTPAGTFNYLSIHFIRDTNHPILPNPSPDFMAAAAYSLPFSVGPHFDETMSLVDSNPQWRGKLKFAVTEWLFNSKGNGERNFSNESPSWMNQGGAVMAAGFLNTVLRHANQIGITDMTGSQEFAGIWKRREQVFAAPAYYVFQMYSSVKGDTVLPVTTDSGTYNVKGGVQPLDESNDVPYVDVVATRSANGRTLTLLCVNRNLAQDLPVRFDLGAIKIAGAATMQQMKSSSRYERNDEIEPHHITPLDGSVKAGKDGDLSITLPHESVTVVRVPVR
jgi:alpha-N-arabinofuranosidase